MVDSTDLRYLEPSKVRIFRVRGLARATVEGERSVLALMATRAFPLSDPAHYIGLLDAAGKDVGMIVDPAQLDAESRAVLEEELDRRYFLPVVRRVISVTEEFGTIYWTFETDRGRKEAVVRSLRDNLQEVAADRVLLTDVEGNRYDIPDFNALDPVSADIVFRHL
ncbi:MAG TPA: DUF1854 domain-containing protein [Chthonomonadales bacterium]|nr:DUF1854 domain-containing protein [Chthonomonadales bacterium]